MKAMVNGSVMELDEGATVQGLLSTLGLSDSRVAVELNRVILRREDYAATLLREDDQVEVVGFVGGG